MLFSSDTRHCPTLKSMHGGTDLFLFLWVKVCLAHSNCMFCPAFVRHCLIVGRGVHGGQRPCDTLSLVILLFPSNSTIIVYAMKGALLSTPLPEGRPGRPNVSLLSRISGLSFDSTLLSPHLFFCRVPLLFLSNLLFLLLLFLLAHSPDFFF